MTSSQLRGTTPAAPVQSPLICVESFRVSSRYSLFCATTVVTLAVI